MKQSNQLQRRQIVVAVLALASAGVVKAQAEPAEQGVQAERGAMTGAIPIKPLPKLTTLPCCKCLVDRSQTDISTGATAPWYVTPPGGSPIPVVATLSPNSLWAGLPFPAKWVDDTNSGGGPVKATGVWVYETQINVPRNCRIPYIRMPTVSGTFRGDDNAKVFVNGTPVTVATTLNWPAGWGFQAGHEGTFTNAPLHYGVNSIRVEVMNMGQPKQLSPSGLIVYASVLSGCDASSSAGTPNPMDVPTK